MFLVYYINKWTQQGFDSVAVLLALYRVHMYIAQLQKTNTTTIIICAVVHRVKPDRGGEVALNTDIRGPWGICTGVTGPPDRLAVLWGHRKFLSLSLSLFVSVSVSLPTSPPTPLSHSFFNSKSFRAATLALLIRRATQLPAPETMTSVACPGRQSVSTAVTPSTDPILLTMKRKCKLSTTPNENDYIVYSVYDDDDDENASRAYASGRI